MTLVAWTLFAFGGAYDWTIVPLLPGAVALTIVVRPRVFRPGARIVDGAVGLTLLLCAVQLVPLRPAIRLALSPRLAAIDDALLLDHPTSPASGPAAPLSVDPAATAGALALAVAVSLLFWCARDIFEQTDRVDARRRAIRAVALCGLIGSALAVLQHVTSPRLLYWVWRPVNTNASPFGPFVNRNDLASWLIMAIPLVLGYLIARLLSSRHENGFDVEGVLDRRGVLLASSLWMMAAALMVTLSRSGLMAGVSGALAIVLLSRQRVERRGMTWLLTGVAATVLAGAAYANTDALMTRAGETLAVGVGGRREIWDLTMTLVRDFPAIGVGVGGYARAMSVYQPPHVFSFNHAHDEYLQLAAEGGFALIALVATAVVGGIGMVRRGLREDGPQAFWIRAGAASALAAVAVQSVWETGLRMPANAVLFAVCAAAATCAPRTRSDRSSPERRGSRERSQFVRTTQPVLKP